MKSLNACRAGSIVALFVLLHLTAFQVLAADAPAAAPAEPASAKSFDDQLVQANVLFKQGKLDEALAAAAAAGKLDPKRFEAPATAALILNAAHKPEEAKAALDEASALAPTDKQDKIRKIAALLASTPTASTPEVGVASTNAPSPAQLTGAARRQYDTLTLIIEDADKAALDADRKRLLREFMGKGAEFIVEHPLQTNVWVLRAAVALELDYTVSGWLAGRRLKELGAEESDDPKVRKVLAMLDRKGWLNNSWKWHDWSKLTTDQVRRLAEDGDEEAQGALGDWFREGRCGLRKDDAEAANWYRRGAEQGHAYSQTQLGLYYMSGRGVEKDAKEAVKWWRKAAEQGSMWAQFNLGTAYTT